MLLQEGSNTCVGKAPILLSPFVPAAPLIAAGASCRGKAHAYAAPVLTLGFIRKATDLSARPRTSPKGHRPLCYCRRA